MKKLGYIFGRRLRGDLILTDDPLANRQARIISPGAWLTEDEQSIYEEDATQNYRIGTRMVVGNRVFHYSRAKENLLALHVAFTDGSLLRSNSDETDHMLAHNKSVSVVTYHPLEAVLVNQFADGILATFGADDNKYPICVEIESNTASDGTGDPCEVTLKDPLPDQILAETWIVCYPNIYAYLLDSGCRAGVEDVTQGYYSGACVPLVADAFAYVTKFAVAELPVVVHAGRYFWGQTWGPCLMWVGNQANLVGQTACQREVFVGADGGLVYRPVNGEGVDWVKQTLGHVLMDGGTVNTANGDQLIM
ncbi:unnamed protein product, partial [marine sediment metagenome]